MLLTDEDITRLAAFLAIPERDFIRHYTVLAANRRQLSLAEQPGGACVFLEDGRCRVHAARPAQCRDFPVAWSVPGCPARVAPPSPRGFVGQALALHPGSWRARLYRAAGGAIDSGKGRGYRSRYIFRRRCGGNACREGFLSCLSLDRSLSYWVFKTGIYSAQGATL
ncbi:MAG: YkgJ family cysteine cluster protein [Verrucomicrobia bacterium]|nr:YkgJ family cysteine cluster protein [Verrucomicrobiota bacterium]